MSDDREIKAIPTAYKGITYKSRMEAQCAVLFDKLGWRFEYEKYSIILPSGTTFIPDFWFPDSLEFIECRGYDSPRGRRQIEEFGEILREEGEFPLDSVNSATALTVLGPNGVSCSRLHNVSNSLVLYLSGRNGMWSARDMYPSIIAAYAVDVSAGKIYLNADPLDEATRFHEFCEQILPVREEFLRRVADILSRGRTRE